MLTTKERTFTREVTAMAPADGGHVEEKFKATFRVLDQGTADDFDLFTGKGTTDFLKAAIVRLDDVAGDNGQVVPYSEMLRDVVIGMPHARAALLRSYSTAISKVKEGN